MTGVSGLEDCSSDGGGSEGCSAGGIGAEFVLDGFRFDVEVSGSREGSSVV